MVTEYEFASISYLDKYEWTRLAFSLCNHKLWNFVSPYRCSFWKFWFVGISEDKLQCFSQVSRVDSGFL